jgi:hypothetical protein
MCFQTTAPCIPVHPADDGFQFDNQEVDFTFAEFLTVFVDGIWITIIVNSGRNLDPKNVRIISTH